MMSDDQPLYVKCGSHGSRIAAAVCGHMVSIQDRRVGFIENSSDPNDFQAWCSDCDELFLSEGAMTEEFRRFNAMAVVCVVCYERYRQQHGSQRTIQDG